MIAVIILNYRGWQDTIGCITSLKKLTYPDFKMIVVDNASGDQSVTEIQAAHPDISIIESSENGGYSAGNNLGIRYALNHPEIQYIWLLNNDTTVDPEALTELVKMAHHYPRDMIGSLILYPDGRYQTVGNRVDRNNWRARGYKPSQLKDGQIVDTLCGCSMLIPKSAFDTIGLLDESYFLYLEDTDFCLRAAQAGILSRVAIHSKIFHKDGASTNKNKHWRTYYSQRNRLIFAHRFAGAFQFKLLVVYNLLYRQGRSWLKALIKNTPEAWQYHRMIKLGMQDYFKGVTGRCPHEI